MHEFYALTPNVRIYKRDRHQVLKKRTTRAIRVYCTHRGLEWCLQIFGPLGVGNFGGQDGKDDVIATAPLSREQVTALRDHLTTILNEPSEVPCS